MGWIFGNDPTGEDANAGRILCELAYAINEREAIQQRAKTTWTDIGADPAVNALVPYDWTKARQQGLIEEMRTAAENVIPQYGASVKAVWVKNDGTVYDKASLLTAAFGAADWCVLAGKDINDVQPVSELLKAVELLDRARHQLTYSTTVNVGWKQTRKLWDVTWPAPGTAVIAIAQANCEGQAATLENNDQYYLTENARQGVGAYPPGTYHRYAKTEQWRRYVLSTIPNSATVVRAEIQHKTGIAVPEAWIAGTYSVRKMTAGQFGVPLANWGAAAGTAIGTYTTPNYETDPAYVLSDLGGTPGNIDPSDTYLYAKYCPPAACPFAGGENRTVSAEGTIAGQGTNFGMRLSFDPAFTYN